MNLLRAAHIETARALVIAVDDVEASLRIATQVRETCPNVSVLARARNRHHELRLRELGVDFVIRETLLSSLSLTGELLTTLGLDQAAAEATVAEFKAHDEQTLERQLAVFHDDQEFRQHTVDASRELRELFSEGARADAGKSTDLNAAVD